ncbi:hypothetical protein CUMW_027680 [Citrus unshiu]|nr:hypothetical protein CUMW_027680 [Citrus unshiu]
MLLLALVREDTTENTFIYLFVCTKEGFCWARTMQRQTIRLRRKYSKAVLRQDVGFFDTDYGAASFTSQVVSTTSNVSR